MLPPGARCPRRGHRSAPRRFDLWAGDGTGTRMANSGESSRTEFWLALEHARCIPVPIRNRPPQGGEGGRFAAPPGLGGRYPDLRRDNERYAARRGRGRFGIYLTPAQRSPGASPLRARSRHSTPDCIHRPYPLPGSARGSWRSRGTCATTGSHVKNSRPHASLRGCKPARASQPNGYVFRQVQRALSNTHRRSWQIEIPGSTEPIRSWRPAGHVAPRAGPQHTLVSPMFDPVRQRAVARTSDGPV